jgi:hypothetical protein
MKSQPKKVREESLTSAAEIRRGLEGRQHSDSSEEGWNDFDEILPAALSLSLTTCSQVLTVQIKRKSMLLGQKRLKDEYARSTKAKSS